MRVRILYLLFWMPFLLFGQNKKLDSLSTFVNSYPANDTIKVNALNELSSQYLWIDFYTSLQHADRALALAQQLEYANGIARAKTLKGFCYWAFGDNELAIEMGLTAAAIAEREAMPRLSSESFLILSRAYMDQNEGDKAADYVNKAEQIAIQRSDWDQLSRTYNLAGVIQYIGGQRDSALQLYNKALSIAQDHGISKINFPRILSNIGECYFKSDAKLAFDYFNKALSIANETGNRTAEASIYDVLGHSFLKKGDDKQAEQYLEGALQLARELGLRRVVRHAYAGLVDLKLKQGKASEAVGYMRSYYEVRDSLLNTAKTRQIVELEARHELEKKEQAIKLLEQEKQIQNIWRNILLAIVILLILVSVVIYYLQKYREHKNREILNLEIDYLTRQHTEISEKYKNSLLSGNEKIIESQDQRLLKKAIEIVENNISDPLFGVEKMAKEIGMSRTNMHRKIKAITGFPPSELIRSIRLRRAAMLIINQADSISQISIAVGFEDHSYFSKSFKKQFGVPPSEYAQSTALQQEVLN